MSTVVSQQRVDEQRETFFRFVFSDDARGIICIAQRSITNGKFEEFFFEYPEEIPDILEHISRNAEHHDMWFCPQVLGERHRRKESVAECWCAWADLDACMPEACRIVPSVTVESSPGRWQALWAFDGPQTPELGEDISRRIAYAHADMGADKTGWDLTQLLRIPFTPNHKYEAKPLVRIAAINPQKYSPEIFNLYESVQIGVETPYDFPEEIPDPGDVIAVHQDRLNPQCMVLISQQPKEDWSKALWKLEVLLFESGLSREEVYALCLNAACNKYARDRRSETMLWRDVCRAYQYTIDAGVEVKPHIAVDYHSALLAPEDVKAVQATPSIVEDYIRYGSEASDAATQYHQAGIFVALSSILAGVSQLPTRHGTMPLNLWFMVLGETTLTRKTTAMDMASTVLEEVIEDSLLATDGSVEGLLAALAGRGGRPSVFRRDEVAGLIEAMQKKDYLGGMAETFASLYDGTTQKRVLRKETFIIYKPRLIFYAGGIRSRVSELLTHSHIDSGFLPRFIIITADGNLDKIRPEGPPTDEISALRNDIIKRLLLLKDHYHTTQKITIQGVVKETPKVWDAKLTTDSWALYNKFSGSMLKDADESPFRQILIPMYERLGRSGLKVAALISAARRMEDDLIVEEEDLIRAFYYVDQWRKYAYSVVVNLERSPFEKQLEQALAMVVKEPGISRAKVMVVLKLSNRSADEVLTTLEQRGMVKRSAVRSRNEKLYPLWEPS